MGLQNLTKSKKSSPVPERGTVAAPEQKSFSASSFAGFLQDGGNWDLSFAILTQYYEKCDPFADAVDMIADAVADITPVVWDKQKEEFFNHDILRILDYPSDSMSSRDFIKHLVGMYLITGNPYLKMIGNVQRPPLELDIVSPATTDVQPDRTGAANTIQVTSEFDMAMYQAESDNGRRRFRHNKDLELWPLWRFNPYRGTRKFFGVPIARPLYHAIEQHWEMGRHNMSLLKKGARPGGSFVSPDALTDKQFERLQEQISIHYIGSDNAGRPLLMEGGTAFTEHLVNNRDMDYEHLTANARRAIYRRFEIPLPLVESDSQTYSNYETSQVALYDRAVLPTANYIFEQLGLAMFYRYGKDWRRYKLTYDETTIPALQIRRTEAIKLESQVNVSTINELRAGIGRDEIDGGDVILRPANEMSALDDDEPESVDDKPVDKEETEKALRAAVDEHGKKRFSEDDIQKLLSR